MMQLTINGDDWISDRERARQKKIIAARQVTGRKAAQALEKAIEAINIHLRACRECQDGSDDRSMGAGDGRNILVGDMGEYMGWLNMRYEKAGGAA